MSRSAKKLRKTVTKKPAQAPSALTPAKAIARVNEALPKLVTEANNLGAKVTWSTKASHEAEAGIGIGNHGVAICILDNLTFEVFWFDGKVRRDVLAFKDFKQAVLAAVKADAARVAAKGKKVPPRDTSQPRILWLRIGIDSGTGKTLGPIFPDGTFEYVPIPEEADQASPRTPRFCDLPARSGGTLDRFVPPGYRTAPAHHDPEFETFTYGDPTANKRRQLLRLLPNDTLVFYAGLRPPGTSEGASLYVIGYFVVKAVHDVPHTYPWPPVGFKHLWSNAHFRRKEPGTGLVVVEGWPAKSRLLRKAVLISDARQYILPEFKERFGLHGSLKRAIGRWVTEGNLNAAVKWLEGLPG